MRSNYVSVNDQKSIAEKQDCYHQLLRFVYIKHTYKFRTMKPMDLNMLYFSTNALRTAMYIFRGLYPGFLTKEVEGEGRRKKGGMVKGSIRGDGEENSVAYSGGQGDQGGQGAMTAPGGDGIRSFGTHWGYSLTLKYLLFQKCSPAHNDQIRSEAALHSKQSAQLGINGYHRELISCRMSPNNEGSATF